MTTLEMIQDWINSDMKKEYIATNSSTEYPVIAKNNGVGVLFYSHFNIGPFEAIEKSDPFNITSHTISLTWKQVEKKYNILEAINKFQQGTKMQSLASGRIMTDDDFKKNEVTGEWIEIYD